MADGTATPNRNDSERIRSLVVRAAEQAAALVASPEVAARWNEPSALAGMTVGALAAHLIRATGATLAYLDRTDPKTQPEVLLTKVTYFHAAVDSPIHDQIKEVSAAEASVGHAELVSKSRQVAQDQAVRLMAEPSDRLVGALGKRMLTLDDFCRTRMIEILMHIDDLAHSVGLPTPELDRDGTGEVIDILVGIARHLHGDWAIIHALARAERSTTRVFPVF
ncbi:hypothetical protein C2W62_04440 [Candidatus Entotheonella serta]|nr:hypothetical protein C2W62_04440 [Candidatus Entotheonella serta]